MHVREYFRDWSTVRSDCTRNRESRLSLNGKKSDFVILPFGYSLSSMCLSSCPVLSPGKVRVFAKIQFKLTVVIFQGYIRKNVHT